MSVQAAAGGRVRKVRRVPDADDRRFGQHVRSCRRARGLTQEALAECSALSPDTIRRLEHGRFSPSLWTIRKLCKGLRLEVATLFAAFALNELDPELEVTDAVRSMSKREQRLLFRLVFIFGQHTLRGARGR